MSLAMRARKTQQTRGAGRSHYRPPVEIGRRSLRRLVEYLGRGALEEQQYTLLSGRRDNPDIEVYFAGALDLLRRPAVSIVGTRDVTEEGRQRAPRLARELAGVGVLVVSGLARGVDTAAPLKGDSINGHFYCNVGGRNRRFDQSNIKEFVDLIPGALADMITQRVGESATLVPIPNSQVTSVDTPDFRTFDLAKAVASKSKGKLAAIPALVFKTPQQKSREGGPRRAAHFESAYNVTQDVRGPIVLLDDVHWRRLDRCSLETAI